ncbi:MAG: GNAT family N-acetyltransferase [Nostoc sp. DedQUE12b]|uniref:GNAT family N-acetyltransferase n=1 Tax=Nostoc sp. DedQUE12b TaxID=3075398 RepID=UPI002AD365D1|nr:GNAT family N-acetyltransferase [Nostoc sp. DedQUE12b]MDZ8087498.1 GNAT family N-acetyltransferase [Nostoc sp. DedQUE12b]
MYVVDTRDCIIVSARIDYVPALIVDTNGVVSLVGFYTSDCVVASASFMENLEKVSLESKRLILQTISLEHTEDVFREFTSEITIFMYPKPAQSLRETEKIIREMILQRENHTDLVLVILKKDGLEFLGICEVGAIDTQTPELGIWLKKSAHGHGFGREAIDALKDWVDKNLEYNYLSYPVDKRNIPSRKIAESLGGKVFREFQQINKSGDLLDEVEYRIYK